MKKNKTVEKPDPWAALFSEWQQRRIFKELVQIRELVGKLRAEITRAPWYREYAANGKYPYVVWAPPVDDGPVSGPISSYSLVVRMHGRYEYTPYPVQEHDFPFEYLAHPSNFKKILKQVCDSIQRNYDANHNWMS